MLATGCGRSGLKNFEGNEPDGGTNVMTDAHPDGIRPDGVDGVVDRRMPVPVSLTLAPDPLSVMVGRTAMFRATLSFSDGSTADMTSTAFWSVGDSSVATVNAGRVTGTKAGSTSVTASASGFSATAKLVVTASTLTSIALTPSAAMLAVGSTLTFRVVGTFADGTSADVTSMAKFSVDRADVLTLLGTGSLVQGRAPGVAVVTATVGTLSQKATVSVFQTGRIVQVVVTPPMVMTPIGSTVNLRAEAVFSDGSRQDVTALATWNSPMNPVVLVRGAGVVFAIGPGRATVTATYSGFTGTANIQVTGAQLVAIQVDPVDPRLGLGVPVNFTATGIYADGSRGDITGSVSWSSSAPGIVSIDAAGRAVTQAVGSSVITATLGMVRGSSTVTVAAATLRSLSVQPTSVTLTIGGVAVLRAIGTYSDGSTVDLTGSVLWSAAPDGVVSPPDGSGIIAGQGVGSAVVTASFAGLSASAKVVVSPATLTAIVVNPSAVSLPVGNTQAFSATGFFSDGSVEDVTNQVTWTSTSDAVASVSNQMGAAGIATARSPGEATIVATSMGISAKATVVVIPATLERIDVSPADATLTVGARSQYKAVGTFSDGSTSDLTTQATWMIDDPNVATVSNAAGSAGVVVARMQGQTFVSATLGAVSGSTSVRVIGRSVTSLDLSPPGTSTPLGVAVQYTLIATFSDGTKEDATTRAQWTSSNPRVATIDGSGRATPVAVGGTAISATFMGATAAAMLQVTPAVVRTVVVTPSALTLPVGFSAQLTVTALMSDGTMQNASFAATWTVDNPMVATVVNGRSVVMATAPGSTVVRATFMGTTGTATVTVTP